uniref:Uncharacterized protein n=1 Tax=Picea sitchensis TaxID=3332 RepID=A9NLV8_PICSI|nr:unknown [Picea sitchensis]
MSPALAFGAPGKKIRPFLIISPVPPRPAIPVRFSGQGIAR